MELVNVLKDISYNKVKGPDHQSISGIAYDSRQVKDGYLFVCIPGLKTDGHLYVQQAIEKGATVILAEREVDVIPSVALLITEDCRSALPVLAARFYSSPSRDMKIVGVTGTNGKTTTTHLISEILERWGKRAGIIGTLYARFGDEERELGHTTPESLDIESFLDVVRENKGDYVVMEVSSHALDLGRVSQIHFNAAVFTNLTQDHLDYHVSMEHYKASKRKLFERLSEGDHHFAVVNADDPYGSDFIKACTVPCYTYGLNEESDVCAMNVKTNLKGTSFKVRFNGEQFDINTKLIGLFSVYNALAAITYALAEGVEPIVIQQALAEVRGVAGRFEQVECGQDFTVVVDYAHTPDGLENILKTGRSIVENRMITVFGCGGDRDRTKRPKMGKIAGLYSDFSIVTSDNPRTEEPEFIIDEIIPGLEENERAHYAKIIDRKEAIRHALNIARKGDLVIIAGKGHETYQLVQDQVLRFDDREAAREILKGITNEEH
ncbi:MAG: UDP-N-acetylmuramoyl-L-alanyl-D-glutamate--2,6-diaminopimelate ligase [Bacillota bacterium]|nr:UDP-N-acetylmuramoyl-L-alanyl-D-glutamate--2,6-diaminopimelate ligase [Bacillota bacterium]